VLLLSIGTSAQEEAYMIPLLLRLNGEAVIDGGHLLYRFPELQKRARASKRVAVSFGGAASNAFRRVSNVVTGAMGSSRQGEIDLQKAGGTGGVPLFVKKVGAFSFVRCRCLAVAISSAQHLLLGDLRCAISW
jgi:hypothetical protein